MGTIIDISEIPPAARVENFIGVIVGHFQVVGPGHYAKLKASDQRRNLCGWGATRRHGSRLWRIRCLGCGTCFAIDLNLLRHGKGHCVACGLSNRDLFPEDSADEAVQR